MNDPELEPIDPQLDALLEAERDALPPEEALGRVWSRVVASLGPAGYGGRGPGRGPNGGGFASRPGLLATLAFVAGGATGAGLHSMLQKPPPERIVYVERRAPAAVAAMPPEGDPPTRAPEPQTVVPPVTPPRASAAHVSPRPAPSSSLSAERAVLDDARRALEQSDGARALALADEHSHRFAVPQLGEEREAIAIQALILAGRYDEARARAARFRAASPNSLFLPAVDASLASIP